jgi:hypothetical protein
MEVILNILMETSIEQRSAIMLATLLLIIPAIPFLTARIRAGKQPPLRTIRGFDEIRRMTGEAMETGQPLHVSVGVQGITDVATPQTLAGLYALRHLSDDAAHYGASSLATASDPTALIAGQDEMRKAFGARGALDRFTLTYMRMIAPQPIAYAAGVMGILSREPVLGNVMIGSFGDEYLLMGETAARRRIPQVVGTGSIEALPFVYASADYPLIGEEIFGVGAYLSGIPSHIASLITQDWMRTTILLAIIVGVILKTF